MALRVLWVNNNPHIIKFELKMLKSVGIQEIYLPKIIPTDPLFINYKANFSEDANLNIPAEQLQLLNETNWYECEDANVWRMAGKHFDLISLLPYSPTAFEMAARVFPGVVVLRAYPWRRLASYIDFIKQGNLRAAISNLGRRFYVAEAAPYHASLGEEYIQSRRVFAPVSILPTPVENTSSLRNRYLYYFCPNIGLDPGSKSQYLEFNRVFSNFEYWIGGTQPIYVNDSKIVENSNENEHDLLISSMACIYFPDESGVIDDTPFLAMQANVPLLFLAGGMLDRLGGKYLPGRCKDLNEVKKKVDRLQNIQAALLKEYVEKQSALLDIIRKIDLQSIWRDAFFRISSEYTDVTIERSERPFPRSVKKISVILPVAYKGGSLRAILALSKALQIGSREAGDSVDLIFAHVDDTKIYEDSDFAELPCTIPKRPFEWKNLTAAEARRAMRYAGFGDWEPEADTYCVPDDGIRQFQDCDLWILVSSRVVHPILPLKPIIVVVYDYIQRYVEVMPKGIDAPFLAAARTANKVFVTTDFTCDDALQYAGIDPRKLRKLPALAPDFLASENINNFNNQTTNSYFIWTTNSAPHKNHKNAAEALRIYYEELDGSLNCMVTGVNSDTLHNSKQPHLAHLASVFKKRDAVRKRVKWNGDLSDTSYREVLQGAKFLWHPCQIDNGTYSVVEAACLGVPSLSSNYPAMHELNNQFSLNLSWMDPFSARDMAKALKKMELNISELVARLPSRSILKTQSLESLASIYWSEVQACM